MKTKHSFRSVLSAVALAATVAVSAWSCTSTDGSTPAPACIAGATVSCACLGGTMGVQTCGADGRSYSMCQCAVTPATDSGASTDAGGMTGTDASTLVDAGTDATAAVDSGIDAATPVDAGVDAPVDAGVDAPADACAGHVTYAGKASMQFGSNWAYQAQVGLAAGNAACQAAGGDHVCNYDELVVAASRGELSTLTTTDTAWLQRTTSVTVSASSPKIIVLGQPATIGTTYAAGGPASNCENWNYSTDHLNDGEFVDFSTGTSTPTFHFDDNPNAIQTTPKDIPCGHNALERDVLCCFAACM